MRATAGNIKKGEFIVYQNEIWQVQKTEFSFQGRGMAVVRIKIKAVNSGKTIELTLKSVDSLELADVSTVQMQYLYNDGSQLHFMDEKTYHQVSIATSLVDELVNFLKPGDKYYLIMYHDKPLNIRPPASVRLKVVETENAVRGNTVSGAKKQATVETGITVTVPLFIKKGDVIAVSSETGQYVERVKS